MPSKRKKQKTSRRYLPLINLFSFSYIEWSSHEPEPGVFSFDGDNDLVQFIKLAQANDLLVILRPGPFIDAERDFVSDAVISSETLI